MKPLRIWHVCFFAVLVALSLCVTSLSTGCGNDSKVLQIKASSSVDNDAHQATINVSELIDGNALVGVVLTYPDGSKKLVLSGNASGAGSSGVTVDNLASGDYSYKVYATPASPGDSSSFPTGQMVEANVEATGSFAIQ
jgi:hypothetical protein